MNEETFKDEKGTFHYEPVVWGDWKIGDEVVFDGFTNDIHAHWSFNEGESYIIDFDDNNIGPRSDKGEIPACDWGFKFSRKVYDVVESVDELRNCSIDILTLDDAILHAEDKYKELKSKNQNQCADNHKMLALWLSDYKTKLQEEKDRPKQEKSLDNLLKELHNLKQEEKEIAGKIASLIKDINQMLYSFDLAVACKEDL